MEALSGDIFATKGIEYLIVIGYLVLLIAFWRLLSRPQAGGGGRGLRVMPGRRLFLVRDGVYYHQGHSWAMPETPDLVRVGMDDFAMRMLGRPGQVKLPEVGARLSQGERGWAIGIGPKSVPVLSPVDGEVVAVNPRISQSPDVLASEPYDDGWLMKVKVKSAAAARKNLLSGGTARAWMNAALEKLRLSPIGEMGVAMPDGGTPVDGFARVLGGEDWDVVAREFLLIDED